MTTVGRMGWLDDLIHNLTRQIGRRANRRAPRLPFVRLVLERLEDRLAPATTITVINNNTVGSGSLDAALVANQGFIRDTDGGNLAQTLSTGALINVSTSFDLNITAQTGISFNDVGTLNLAPTGKSVAFSTDNGDITFTNPANTLYINTPNPGFLQLVADGNGNLNLANLGTLGGGVVLDAGGTINAQQIFTVGIPFSGNIDLQASDFTLNQGINAGATGSVDFTSNTPFNFNVGANGVPGVSAGLTDAELGRVTAGVLRITTHGGNIAVSGAVTRHPGFNALDLFAGASAFSGLVTQSAPLSVANLFVSSPQGVDLTNAGNTVDVLAGLGRFTASFSFTDAGALAIGQVDSSGGVVTSNGNVTLTTGGALTLNEEVLALGGNTLTLNCGGPVTEAAPSAVILGTNVLLLGAGPFNLTNPGNDVDTLAAAVSGPGNDFNYTDANGFTVGAVAGVAGISTTGLLGNTVTLTAGGAVTQVAGATIQSDRLQLLGAGPFTLDDPGNEVTQMRGDVTNDISYTNAFFLTLNAFFGSTALTSTSGAISIRTIDGPIQVLNSVSAATTAHLTAGDPGNNDNFLTSSAAISAGSDVTLTADSMILQGGTINVGAGTVTLVGSSPGRPIALFNGFNGPSDPSGQLFLSQSELSTITAGLLRIGDPTSGNLQVSSAISAPPGPGGWNRLSLTSHDQIFEPNGGSNALTVGELALQAGSTVNMISNNQVSVLAALAASSGGAFTFIEAPLTPPLTIGVVDGVAGVVSNNNPIVLYADDFNFTQPINAGSATVDLSPTNSNLSFVLGLDGVPGSSVGLTDVELGMVTASILRIATPMGGIDIAEAVTRHAGFNTLSLSGGGGPVTQLRPLSVANLSVSSSVGVFLTHPDNDVDMLAGLSVNASVFFTDTDGFTIGTVGATSGLTALNGDVTLNKFGGVVTQGLGLTEAIQCMNLLLTGFGPYILMNPENTVSGMLAGNVFFGGVSFTERAGTTLTIGTVGGVVGLSTPNAIGGLTTPDGINLSADDFIFNQQLNAANGTVNLQTTTANRGFNLGSGSVEGAAGLTNADLAQVAAFTLVVSSGTGNISVTNAISVSNVTFLLLLTGGAIDDASGSLLTVPNLDLEAGGGIGDASNPLVTAVSNLAFNNAVGIVNIQNTGALNIIGGLETDASSNGGTTILRAASPITFQASVFSAGSLFVIADETPGEDISPLLPPDDDITIPSPSDSGVITIESQTGDIFFQSGDSIVLGAGTLLKADVGAVHLAAGIGDVDGDAVLTLEGDIFAPQGIFLTPATSSFVVVAFPSSTTEGAPVSVAVAAVDALGRLATTYTGTIHFNSNLPQALLPPDYTFQPGDMGVHTFTGLTFPEAGTWIVSVSDTVNPLAAGVSAPIPVFNVAPNSIQLGLSGLASPGGLPINLTGSFADPGTVETYTVVINWGDGSPVTTLDLAAGVHSFGSSHIYPSEGNFAATVRVADSDGGSDEASIIVPILPAKFGPIAAVSLQPGQTGTAAVFDPVSGELAVVTLVRGPGTGSNGELLAAKLLDAALPIGPGIVKILTVYDVRQFNLNSSDVGFVTISVPGVLPPGTVPVLRYLDPATGILTVFIPSSAPGSLIFAFGPGVLLVRIRFDQTSTPTLTELTHTVFTITASAPTAVAATITSAPVASTSLSTAPIQTTSFQGTSQVTFTLAASQSGQASAGLLSLNSATNASGGAELPTDAADAAWTQFVVEEFTDDPQAVWMYGGADAVRLWNQKPRRPPSPSVPTPAPSVAPMAPPDAPMNDKAQPEESRRDLFEFLFHEPLSNVRWDRLVVWPTEPGRPPIPDGAEEVGRPRRIEGQAPAAPRPAPAFGWAALAGLALHIAEWKNGKKERGKKSGER